MFGHGKRHGREAHGHRHGRSQACRQDFRRRDESHTGRAVYPPAGPGIARSSEAAPAMAEGTCPLCKNHCPLSAPGCKKGTAYAAAATRSS